MPLIAIVDDDAAVREALCDLFQVAGLSATTFAGAADFLAAPDEFDLLVTDVRMPEMDGIELQRRLRAGGSSMPVIFITSLSDETTRASALRDGAAAWFTKPVANGALLDALAAALGKNVAGGTETPPRD